MKRQEQRKERDEETWNKDRERMQDIQTEIK